MKKVPWTFDSEAENINLNTQTKTGRGGRKPKPRRRDIYKPKVQALGYGDCSLLSFKPHRDMVAICLTL